MRPAWRAAAGVQELGPPKRIRARRNLTRYCASGIADARAMVHSVFVRSSSAFAITPPPRRRLPPAVEPELMPTAPESVCLLVGG